MINKRKALLAALVCLSAASLASCVRPQPSTSSQAPVSSSQPASSSSAPTTSAPTPSTSAPAPSTSTGPTGYWTNTDESYENVSVEVTTAGAYKNFVAASYEDRAEILGLLEEYAMANGLTGIVLYDDGGYAKYSERLTIPTKVKTDAEGNPVKIANTEQHEYVVSYGFGILSEGDKSAKDPNDPYDRYYKTYETSDPQTLNYMNDKGSVVGGLQPYVSSTYFDARLTETKDSYEWFASAASEVNSYNSQPRPIPQNLDNASGLATKYRIYVRTDMKYNTLGKFKDTYAGRTVALDDFVTPWKELHKQSNALQRATDNFGTAAEIAGLREYYVATKDANADAEAAWENVGIKTGSDTNGSYLEFDFLTPCSPFYAMYYLNSSLYSPIPADFLEEIGGIRVWESSNTDGTLTPVDTTLSTGPYVLASWKTNEEIIFSKNELCSVAVKGGEHRYKIPGVHVDIFEAATKDPLAAWNEFQAGNFDACGIPTEKVATEKGTDGTQVTKGSSTTKLNVNTCTAEEWEALFGENGTVTQTPKSEYWAVEPALSNEDFIRGLNLAMDREDYADKRGVTPSCSYFSDAYMSNPESGISYNSTEAHQKALEAIYGEDVETYGYNLDEAALAFQKAAAQLVADGVYKSGDTITLEIAWQAQSQIETSGKDIEAYLKEAWDLAEELAPTGIQLKVEHWFPEVWSDVYYKKMMVGQFDIGFGGISGNTFNPLNFMEVLKSDNSSGFTLNWGPNTNDPNALIEYGDGKYTYDALWKAADTGALVSSDGTLAKTHGLALVSNVKNADDNSRTITLKYGATNIEGVCSTSIASVVLCWYEEPTQGYAEVEVKDYKVDEAAGTITFTVSAAQAEAYQGIVGVDVYWTSPELGDSYDSIYTAFPYWVE